MTKKSPLAARPSQSPPTVVDRRVCVFEPSAESACSLLCWKGVSSSLSLSLCAWSEVLYGLAQLEVCARWRVYAKWCLCLVALLHRFQPGCRRAVWLAGGLFLQLLLLTASDWRSDSHQYHRAVQTAERAAIVNTPAKASPASSSSVFSRGFVTPSAFLMGEIAIA